MAETDLLVIGGGMAGLTAAARAATSGRHVVVVEVSGEVGGSAPKTLEQVGLIIGVTKERVRQIQNNALRKMRVALEERFLAA